MVDEAQSKIWGNIVKRDVPRVSATMRSFGFGLRRRARRKGRGEREERERRGN